MYVYMYLYVGNYTSNNKYKYTCFLVYIYAFVWKQVPTYWLALSISIVFSVASPLLLFCALHLIQVICMC